MAVERNLYLSLIVAVTAFLLCRAAEMRDPISRTDAENQGTDHNQEKSSSFPVELLGGMEDDSITVSYGVSLFEDVYNKLVHCREERRNVLSKVNQRSSRLQEYHRSVNKAIEKPMFEELVHENKAALDHNFEQAFAELDHNREDKLAKQRGKCNKELDALVEGKVHEAITYAEMLVIQDPRVYESLTLEASAFGTQLRSALAECSSHKHPPHADEGVQEDSHGEMNFDLCRRYALVVERLIDFIDQFLTKTDELSLKYLYTDDEDYDFGDKLKDGSGDFGDYETPEKKPEDVEEQPPPVPKPHPPEVKGQLPISSFFEPGPVILGTLKPEDEKTKAPPTKTDVAPPTKTEEPSTETIPDDKSSAPPSTADVAPPTKSDEAPPTSQTETKPEDVGDYHYDGDEKEVADVTTTTGVPFQEDVTESTKPTHEYPTWADDAFDYILHHGEEKDGEKEDEKDFDTDGLTRSKSTSKAEEEQEEREPGGIDLQLPGYDVEIDSDGIDINGQQGGLSIVIDDDEGAPTDPELSEEDHTTFIEYMLIYFFATLGCLLILTIIVLSIAIIALRSRSRTPKDTPLLSEDDKLAVMKQTGYVNPTYKFFDTVKEV